MPRPVDAPSGGRENHRLRVAPARFVHQPRLARLPNPGRVGRGVVSNANSHNVDQNVDQNVDLRAAVAIGASAGGIEALSRLVAGLSRSCGTHDW